ncbi:MAG: hypothetical protein AB1714_06945 [Acidobacteriota bacterium]
MELYPALKSLRKAILDRYTGLPRKELGTHVRWLLNQRIMLEKPFVGLQPAELFSLPAPFSPFAVPPAAVEYVETKRRFRLG